MPVNFTEAELIERARSGGAEAFCLLAQVFERRVYNLALHYCRNAHDAEDLSQEVWLKAYQALSTFRGDSSFYAWLRRIMINCFLNHRRTRRFRWRGQQTEISFLSAEQIDLADSERSNPEVTLQQRVLAGRVMEALSRLSSQQRLIFLLKHEEGMTYEEISTALGCSTGAVKKSLFRAMAKLRTQLAVDDSEADCLPSSQVSVELGA